MQTIVNLGTGGADLNGQNGSTTGADSNDPKYLAWEGENYVYLPGVFGNHLSVPDEAALDITGDIDIRVKVAMDDWTPAVQSALMGKWLTTAVKGYSLHVTTGGTLQFYWSADGTTTLNKISTAATGVTDGSAKWVRATLDVDNGAAGHDVKFYLSDDGVSWTQLGSTVTTAGTTSVYANAQALTVGAGQSDGQSFTAGKFYRAQVLNGISGTPVLDIDCSQISSGSDTSFTALTGQTVTINRSASGRKSVAVVSPVWLFGSDDYMQVPDDALMDFTQDEDFTLITVIRAWATAATLQITAAKKWSSSGGTPGYLLGINTSNATTSRIADGTNQTSVVNGSYSSGAVSVIGCIRDAAAGTMQNFTGNSFAAATPVTMIATAENDKPFNVGRFASGSSYFDGEVLAVALYRRKLSSSEITALTTYYQNKAA